MSIKEITFVGDEIRRIYADTAQGEQSTMVQMDMKKWAQKRGFWPQLHYNSMIAAYAVDRGWMQEDFTGMEIIE